MKIAENITELVGNTPLVYLKKINTTNNNIIAKLESFNPCNSVKDRIALNMIESAEKKGTISPEKTTLIEPTSGNTGIGLAFIAASKSYKLILVMPETMSEERKKMIKIFGAELVLTPGNLGMQGAVDKAKELNQTLKNSYIFQQFENKANPEIHRKTTALEIWNDTEGKIDIIVAGIGTGGTITGIGEVLKQKNPKLKIIGVEPRNSPLLTENKAGPHKIQGIGANFIPKNLNQSILDQVITVKDNEAIETAKELAKKEGILTGISGGASVFATLKIAKENQNKNIIVILPDFGERYVSTDLFKDL